MTETVRREVSYRTGPSPTVTGHSWVTPIAVVVAAAILLLALFRETTRSMVSMWQNSSYSHGYLVLPSSLYLIWVCRKRVASLEPRPNPRALVLLAALGLGWFLGDLGAVEAAKQFAVVGMLPAMVWLALGTDVTREILFPLLLLFFAVPVGEVLVPPLQDFTAFFAVKALNLVGVPVLLEGRLISIPSGVWEVAQACAGLRYLLASVMLGCFYAYVVYRNWTRRIAFVAASVAVPILANGLRAFGIILLGHLTHNRLATGVDHLIYGGLFFGVVMFILFAAGWRWRELEASSLSGAGLNFPSPGRPRAERPRGAIRGPLSAWAPALWAAAGVALAALAPVSAQRLFNGVTGRAAIEVAAPSVVLPWKSLGADVGRWRPRFAQAAGELKQTYTSGAQQVYFYLAYYAGGRGGAKLVSSMNLISEGPGLSYVGERSTTATVDGESVSVHETVLRSQQATLLVWSWYWVDGKFTDSPYRAKLLRVKARLFGGPQASALIAVGANYAPDREEAANALQDFLRHTTVRAALNGLSK